MTLNEHHEILSRLAEVGIVAGNRVRFTQEIERYPLGIIKPGETGTIVDVTGAGFVAVELDSWHPGFEDWDNELHFNFDTIPEHVEELKTLQVLTEEMPEVG
jgi:Fe2+ transport system protein FeoA